MTPIWAISNSSFHNGMNTLNECLIKGPNTLADLYENLIKFRGYKQGVQLHQEHLGGEKCPEALVPQIRVRALAAVWLQHCPVWGLTGSSYNEPSSEEGSRDCT